MAQEHQVRGVFLAVRDDTSCARAAGGADGEASDDDILGTAVIQRATELA